MARSCQAVKILVAWFSETHFLDNQAKRQQIDNISCRNTSPDCFVPLSVCMILSRLPTRFGTRGDNPRDNPLGLGGYPMFNPAIFPKLSWVAQAPKLFWKMEMSLYWCAGRPVSAALMTLLNAGSLEGLAGAPGAEPSPSASGLECCRRMHKVRRIRGRM